MPKKSGFLSDYRASEDGLNFGIFKPALRNILESAETPLTVGVFGTWGSGKTTLLNMLKDELDAKKLSSLKTVWFTAWKYEQHEALWRAFMLRVVDGLHPRKEDGSRYQPDDFNTPAEKAKREALLHLGRLERSIYETVNWQDEGQWSLDTGELVKQGSKLPIWLAFHLAGLGSAAKDLGLNPEMAKLLEREVREHHLNQLSYMEQFAAEFQKAVQMILGKDGRLVVFVDDLDRCLPEKAVEVLEAIKLFLDGQGDGSPVPGVTVEAYTDTAYTGLSAVTDQDGVALLTLPDGWYRFRVEQSGVSYWSGPNVHCAVPNCERATVIVGTSDMVTITAFNTYGDLLEAGLQVTAYDGDNPPPYSAVTDDNGQAFVELPEGNYRFRLEYAGVVWWSGLENHCAVPGCSGATLRVAKPVFIMVRDTDEQPVIGAQVYAFDGETYTGFSLETDENGNGVLGLPFGEYRFRADVDPLAGTGGAQFWSDTENHCELPGCEDVAITVNKPVTVTVTDPQGSPVNGAQVQVYHAGLPAGKSGQTDAAGQTRFVLADGEYQFRAEYDGSVAWSEACAIPGCETASLTVSPAPPDRVVTITYSYDDLYRLEAADYSTGDSYDYAYDAVGNRLAQQSMVNGLSSAVAYAYDDANRLLGVSTGSTVYDPLTAVTYAWDANGNLLSDGVNIYAYDSANRLSTLNGPSTTVGYAYNGLNDRLQEIANGSTTTFTMDLNTGLTQALSDGTHTYTYGLGRIAQYDTTAEYFLGDALGSVRQLTDAQGQITLAKAYNPYGEVTQSAGAGQTSYGYTNEYQDSYIKLIYLRSRFYSPETGRFQTRDTWQGDYNRPGSLNRWNYVEGNVVNRVDPSGHIPECGPFEKADLTQWIIDELNADKNSWIISLIKTYISMSPVNQEVHPYPPSQSLSSFDPALYGYILFADAVKPEGLWDFKLEISRIVGANIRISDNWYSYDVPGNIAFGYLGLAAGISEQDLHCGADWAADWSNDKSVWGYCSGSDPTEDHDAIEAGFDLWKVANGGPITLPILTSTLQKYALRASKAMVPNFESIQYWPYKVGTFDGKKSIFAHR